MDFRSPELTSVFPRSRCIKDDVLPLADGATLHVPAGTELLISVDGVNTDTDIWGPDAKVWRPERWLEPGSSANAKVPGVYANM